MREITGTEDASMATAIIYVCWCGRTYAVEAGADRRVCACGVAFEWPPVVKVYVQDSGGEWCEKEHSCEGCRRPLLDEQVAWRDAEGVCLCAQCAEDEGEVSDGA